MKKIIFTALICLAALPSMANAQQAAGTLGNTNQEFEALIHKCDDTDIFILRARARLLEGRTSTEIFSQVETMMNEGLAICGEGNIEAAKAKITEAIAIGDDFVTQKFAAEEAAQSALEPQQNIAISKQGDLEKSEKPWWQFW